MSENLEFQSLNPETGLLDDPEEVVMLALDLLIFIRQLLDSDLLRRQMPQGFFLDAAAILVSAESMLIPTSQANYLRQLAIIAYGFIPASVEYSIRSMGYSETLPKTHPDAPHPPLTDVSLVNPAIVEESYFLKKAIEDIKAEQAMKGAPIGEAPQHSDENLPEPPPEPVVLPESVQSVLDSILKGMGGKQSQED
jgi:hypothetical protein